MRSPFIAKTESPTEKRATRAPRATTTPDSSTPSVGLRGPNTPNISRAISPNPGGTFIARSRTSPELTAVARTSTSTSSGAGSGCGTSRIDNTSGEP
jgi:hypothetical protein